MWKKKREFSLSNRKRNGAYLLSFIFIFQLFFGDKKCTLCEGKVEEYYFPWSQCSTHIKNCPHKSKKGGNFHVNDFEHLFLRYSYLLHRKGSEDTRTLMFLLVVDVHVNFQKV